MKYLFTLLLVVLIALVACSTPTPIVSPLATLTPAVSPLVVPVTNNLVSADPQAQPNPLQSILDFCVDTGISLILGLCALDIAFGLGAALRSGVFDLKKVGQFYKTQVLALFIPYLAVLGISVFAAEVVSFLPAALAPATMLGGITAVLAGSIVKNVAALRASP